MIALMAFVKGIMLGIAIAAPVGPIGILCIRKTLTMGRRAGFISGLGAATADAIYGFMAMFGLAVITQFLIKQSAWISLLGSLFLFYLACKTMMQPVTYTLERDNRSTVNDMRTFATTLLLTLTNPMTILLFLGIFAGVSMGTDPIASLCFIVGVFLGSALWWFALTSAVGLFRKALGTTAMRMINGLSSLILIGFGCYNLYQSLQALL